METRKDRTYLALTAKELYRTSNSDANEPEYHTYRCRERQGLINNERHLEHSLHKVSNARYPVHLNSCRWNKTLETFANRGIVSQKSKGSENTPQSIYQKTSRDHHLTKKSTYTLIKNLKYGSLNDVQIFHSPTSLKPTVGQLAAKSLKRVLESPFKKPTLFSVHKTELVGRNTNILNTTDSAYSNMPKEENESISQGLIHQRTFTKLPLKAVTRDAEGPVSPMSMQRSVSLDSIIQSSGSETKHHTSPESSLSLEKIQESKDSTCISQIHFCQHGISIGPSNESPSHPSTHSMSVQTLEEHNESKLKIPTTITVETSTVVYSTDKASISQKGKICHLATEEVESKISNNIESQPNSNVLVNIPLIKSDRSTQDTTTQYRMKDDGGKHYIIPTKYKTKHNIEISAVKVTSKKPKKVKKNTRKKSISHSGVTTNSSSYPAKQSISSYSTMKKISKYCSKQKNCSEKSTSVKSIQVKQSKSNEKKTIKTERVHFSQSGNCVRSKSGKQNSLLRKFSSLFSTVTLKTSEENKSATEALSISNSSQNTIQTQTSDTTLSHNSNLPLCCLIWGHDDDIKKKLSFPNASRSKFSSVVANTKKRKPFTANCIKRRRTVLKPTRSLVPNISSVKFPNPWLAPRLPHAAVQALNSIPTKVVVRGQDPPYALRRLLATPGTLGLESSTMRYLQSGFPWSEEMQSLQKTLVDTSNDRREKREDGPSGMCPMANSLPISKKLPLSTFIPGSLSGYPMDSLYGWSSIAGSINRQDVPNGSIAWAPWPPMKNRPQQISSCDACTNTVDTSTNSASLNIDTATSAEALVSANKATSVESNIILVTRSTSMSFTRSVDAAAGTSVPFVSNRTAMEVKELPPILSQVPFLATSRSVPGPKRPTPRAKNFPPASTKAPSEAKLVCPESYPLCRVETSTKCFNTLTRVSGRTDLRDNTIEEE